MESIIQQLFNGNLCDEANKVNKLTYERQHRLEALIKIEEKLLNSLSETQKQDFDRYRELSDANWAEEADGAYKRGFQIGGLFAIEMHRIE